MKNDKCIIQNVHIAHQEAADAKRDLELLLAQLICKELNNDFAEYKVVN